MIRSERDLDREPPLVESEWWPARVGRLLLTDDLALVVASYVDPLTDAEYRIGREQGGERRGWWVQSVDESTRSDGYRDYSPGSQEQALARLRSIASASVGTEKWSTVEIEPADQVGLDQWGVA